MVRGKMEEQEQSMELESLYFVDLHLGDAQRNQAEANSVCLLGRKIISQMVSPLVYSTLTRCKSFKM